jgi:1-acyl-sn-glycerol-3-phosphate acyltransferase
VIRPLLALVTFVVATVLASLAALVAGLLDRTGERVMPLARLWSRVIMAAAGVRLEVKSRAPLDPGRAYVFMANHASTIDIWAALLGIPISFRFMAKKQLGYIPLFGWALRAARFIFIDRQNAVAARRSIEEAARRIRAGQSVVIYPEGTRTRDGQLAAFKKGGFHLAMTSGAEIVPVAIRGSRALMPAGAFFTRPGKVTLMIDTPIPTAGLTLADRDALVTKVRDRVAALLAEPPPDSFQLVATGKGSTRLI